MIVRPNTTLYYKYSAFTALAASLYRRERIGIALLTFRKGTEPRLVALIPEAYSGESDDGDCEVNSSGSDNCNGKSSSSSSRSSSVLSSDSGGNRDVRAIKGMWAVSLPWREERRCVAMDLSYRAVRARDTEALANGGKVNTPSNIPSSADVERASQMIHNLQVSTFTISLYSAAATAIYCCYYCTATTTISNYVLLLHCDYDYF